MKAGVSTACLYPELIEDALCDILEHNITNTELFVNTHSEIIPEFTEKLAGILTSYSAVCSAYHPFTCPIEPMMLFSGYERRVKDMLEYHKFYFDAMNRLGTDIFILHGNLDVIAVPEDFYFDIFSRLSETAEKFGITVAQENVARCQSHSLHFMQSMLSALGEKAKFVLDIKQAVRSDEDPFEIARTLGNSIIHIHMSDHDEKNDCLLPGKGNFNIEKFLRLMAEKGFDGTVMTELYRSNFISTEELAEGFRYLDSIIKRIDKERNCL